MNPTRCIVAALAISLLASAAHGQAGTGGTISQGSIYFRQQDSPTDPTGDGYVDGTELRVFGPASTNHCYQSGWWYRLATDTREYTLANANPALTSWSGNLGVGHYDLPGFEAHAKSEVAEVVAGRGGVTHTLEITNTSASPIRITVFHYLDYDLLETPPGDTAAITANPDIMRINEGATFGEYGGQNADAFLVNFYDTVLVELYDRLVTNFTPPGTGLPFGPDDWTAAFQWNEVEIAPGGIRTYTAVTTIMFPVVFPAVCYPDCNGDGNLTVADFGCFQTKFVAGCP